MISVVEQGGFQYKVAEGDIIKVPLIEAEEGAKITLDKVLLVGEGDSIKIGNPEVKGAKVTAKIVGHSKSDKVLIIKKKKRKDYKRKNGHRQGYTKVHITSIKG